MRNKVYKLSKEDEVTTYSNHYVFIKGITEENPVNRRIEDGKYIIFQTYNDVDDWIPKPVLAFTVENGNFTLNSVTGTRDFSTLASEVWHLQFTNKQKTAMLKLKQLKKQLSRIERDVKTRIKRDPRYNKK